MAWELFGIQDRSSATPVSAEYVESFGEHVYGLALRDAQGVGGSSDGMLRPEDFDAQGDGLTDDTVAIQACWDAVIAQGYGGILFGPKTYIVDGAVNQSRGGNSVIALRDAAGATTSPPLAREYFVKGVPGRTRLRRNNSAPAGTYAVTGGPQGNGHGPPSVVGGPNWEKLLGGTADYTDYGIVWDGVDIYVEPVANGPTWAGLDLGMFTRGHVHNSQFRSIPAVIADVPPRYLYSFGLRLPTGLNFGESTAHTVLCVGWYCGFVIHSAHIDLEHTNPKWCVIGYGIDCDKAHDNHNAYGSYFETGWNNYHLTGWTPDGGTTDIPAANRKFYFTGTWDIEDYPADSDNPRPGTTKAGDTTDGSPNITNLPNKTGLAVGQYVVSSLFPVGSTIGSIHATLNQVTVHLDGAPVDGAATQTNREFKFGPDWWYTLYHVYDLNDRIFGHLDYQKVKAHVSVALGALTMRGGQNLALTQIGDQRRFPNGEIVTAEAALPLPRLGEFFVVAGTTGITSITSPDGGLWPGRTVTLKFNASLTVSDGNNLSLSGSFSATAGDTLTLTSDGTDWYEISRAP